MPTRYSHSTRTEWHGNSFACVTCMCSVFFFMCLACDFHLFGLRIVCVKHVTCLYSVCVFHVFSGCVACVQCVFFMCSAVVLHVFSVCFHVFSGCVACI